MTPKAPIEMFFGDAIPSRPDLGLLDDLARASLVYVYDRGFDGRTIIAQTPKGWWAVALSDSRPTMLFRFISKDRARALTFWLARDEVPGKIKRLLARRGSASLTEVLTFDEDRPTSR